MKHTIPNHLMGRELLCFVRDNRPTVYEFVARFSGEHGQTYHVVRKSGVVEIVDGRVTLNREQLTTDGKHFVWGVQVFSLERDEVSGVCWGPRG